MTKLKQQVVSFAIAFAVHLSLSAQDLYKVSYVITDSFHQNTEGLLQLNFSSRDNAIEYVSKLPVLLHNKGFITASIDAAEYDSLHANIQLYLGKQYKWAKLKTMESDEDILQGVRWNNRQFSNSHLNYNSIQEWQEKILNYLEENGHPFASVSLDSIQLKNDEVDAVLKITRGPKYKIDSIRVYGNVKIKNTVLQKHLEIENGSIYNKKKLNNVSEKLSELLYVEEEKKSDLSLLGTGSVLNLYLKPVKNSQFNILVGLLPNTDRTSKRNFQVTGEANILLRNSLGAGETFGLNWQQLQRQSPRLNILFRQPYVFGSPFGLNFNFDMFRKDSIFLTLNATVGASLKTTSTQTSGIFLERRQTIVNGINTADVLFNKRLPQEADVSSLNLGVQYEFNNTDYRFNPRKGNELIITTSAGTKKIRKNNQILELKDLNDPGYDFESLYDTIKLKSYQFRINAIAARFFPIGNNGTIKTGINAALYQSQNFYRNELFQIGGYRILRGFDEESQYVQQFAVGTLEYRYLIAQNSNFFVFTDAGWGKHSRIEKHTYIGTGAGISFETKAGIFNLVWAVGKRNDSDLNLRNSKIHLGFVNYF